MKMYRFRDPNPMVLDRNLSCKEDPIARVVRINYAHERELTSTQSILKENQTWAIRNRNDSFLKVGWIIIQMAQMSGPIDCNSVLIKITKLQ